MLMGRLPDAPSGAPESPGRQAADLAFRVASLRLFPSKVASLALSQIKQYARC